ncbi:MAG: AI-2E family transporter [Verrucomicrobiota bacterium]
MNNASTETKPYVFLPAWHCVIFLVIFACAIRWLDLGTLTLTILFSYFALEKLLFLKSRPIIIAIFTMAVFVICLGLAYFIAQAIQTLPRVASTAIPIVIQYAKSYDIELPFTDWDSLKDFSLTSVKNQLGFIGNFANEATRQTIFLIIGLVVAIGLFVDSALSEEKLQSTTAHHLYSALSHKIVGQFQSFYSSFRIVMGAQLLISIINTTLTSIFLIGFSFPYTPMAIAITFLCGLLPIIGNLISNTVIVGIGFTVSLKMAGFALIFLIVLHKLEYFLNSKIIGDKIKNPMWLTLVGLIIGERLLGIPGMILSPVVLHFFKTETAKIKFPYLK